MQMRVTIPIALLSVFSACFAQSKNSNQYNRTAFINSSLIHAEEIANHGADLQGDGKLVPWSREFILNMDKVDRGKGTIFASHQYLACDSVKEKYVRSECGKEKLIVLSIKNNVEVGQKINLNKNQFNGATGFAYIGLLDSPGRNGCFGYASDGYVSIIKKEGLKLTVSIDVKFYMVSLFNFPDSCGEIKFAENDAYTIVDGAKFNGTERIHLRK
jgi:hypothetical protein